MSDADAHREQMRHAVKLIRYNDLVAKGVVASRMTLWRLIREHNFPEGKLITPNARAWDEAEVDAWIAGRPSAPKHSTRKAEPHPAPIAA